LDFLAEKVSLPESTFFFVESNTYTENCIKKLAIIEAEELCTQEKTEKLKEVDGEQLSKIFYSCW
jgi:hypothetical protein